MYNSEVATIREDSKIITLKTLALPLIFKNFITYFINTLGVLVLSGYSESVVSATSIANQIITLPQAILNTVATGTVILISIALGKKEKSAAAEICGNGIILSSALSIIAGAFIALYSENLIEMMNLTGEAKELATVYLRVMSVCLIIQVAFDMFQQLLICNGFSGVIMIAGIVTGILNAGLSYVVIYTCKSHLNAMTSLGIKTCLAWLIGLLITLIFFCKAKCPVSFKINIFHFPKILKLGLPAGMCLISYNFSNTVTTGFLAMFGEAVINAKVYITNIVVYVPMVGYAIACATSVFMGRLRGAKRFESMKILYSQNLKIILLINSALSILVFVFHKQLLSLFTKDITIINIATLVMLIDIPLEIARGINHISENSLNPNGDVKTTSVISIFSAWVFSVLLGYILCVLLKLGLYGLWIAFLANEVFKATLYIIRWKSEKWKAIDI